jgi:photosystem II stability/assembly factor-like uncharacterized protein
MRSVAPTIALLAVGLLRAAPARANGRFPSSNQIVFSPSDPNLIVLRATFGILVSRDGGATWTWLCEDALGIPSSFQEDPAVALTASSALVAGLSQGLHVSPDTGCNWAYAASPLAQQVVSDVVVRRDAPDTVLAGISALAQDAGAADAAVSYQNQLLQSTDDGATWAPLGVPFDPRLIVTTFDVAPSDPNRLYAAGFFGTASARSFWLAISKNAGAAWTEVALPLDPATEQEPFVAAVDPTNADRVYVRSQGSPSRLFVSNDGGQTFQVAFSLLNAITGFALAPDGSTVYAGSFKDGLYLSTPPGSAFQKVSSLQVGCLAARGGELWACSAETSGFVVGVSTDRGATFTPRLHLPDIRGPIACGADATAAACGTATSAFANLCYALSECFGTGPLPAEYEGGRPAPMAELCRAGPSCPCQALGSCVSADAGSGADAGAPPASAHPGKGCGCSMVSLAGGESASAFVACSALLAAAARRRRRPSA